MCTCSIFCNRNPWCLLQPNANLDSSTWHPLATSSTQHNLCHVCNTPQKTHANPQLWPAMRDAWNKKRDFAAFIWLIEQVFIEAAAAGDQHTRQMLLLIRTNRLQQHFSWHCCLHCSRYLTHRLWHCSPIVSHASYINAVDIVTTRIFKRSKLRQRKFHMLWLKTTTTNKQKIHKKALLNYYF